MTQIELGIAVKSTAGTAAVDLDKLTVSAGKAERGVKGLETASRASAGALQPVTTQLAGIERNAAMAASGLGKVSSASTLIKTSATSAATAIGQEATALRSATDAITRNTAAANANAAARKGMGGSGLNTANIAAQFQDIGVTAAMGMSPLQIALQQGTQLSAVLGGQGLTGVVKSLGAAFASVLSPVSLLTIGAVALGAAGLQALGGFISSSSKAKNGINSVTQAMAEQAGPVDAIKGRISELESITDAYAKAIRGTAQDQSIASAAIIANSEREFNAKKSLLDLELKRQKAAIAVGEAELTIAGRNLAKDVRAATPTGILDPVAGGFADPKIGQFVRSPQQANLLQSTQDMINANPLNDQLKEMRANLELSKLATEGLDDALGTTFSEGVATSIGRVASTAKGSKTESEKAAEKYADLIRLAQQRIEMSGVEQSTIGMTEEAMARMAITQELLNKAANDNIDLTPKQTAEIERLGAGIAAAEEQTKRLTEAYDFGKGVFNSFFSDLKIGLTSGKDLWETMGNAATSVLDKITSKALDMATNGIWDMIFGAVSGGLKIGGGMTGTSSITGSSGGFFPAFAGGGYTGDGARSGGLDGQGGFLAMMHPQETVTDHTRGQAANGNSVSIVRIELSGDVEGRILQQGAKQSVQIVRAAAPSIAEQGAQGAGAKLAGGEFDGGMRRYGVQPQAKRR